MGLYTVTLGVDRAAKDTHRRMTLTVPAQDRLSAAIAAEHIGDSMVHDPAVEYTHAVSVKPAPQPKPQPAAAAMPVAVAA